MYEIKHTEEKRRKRENISIFIDEIGTHQYFMIISHHNSYNTSQSTETPINLIRKKVIIIIPSNYCSSIKCLCLDICVCACVWVCVCPINWNIFLLHCRMKEYIANMVYAGNSWNFIGHAVVAISTVCLLL